LSEHHNLLSVPRHVSEPVTVETSAVNRDDGSSGDRMGDLASFFMK
jgi:hypothetical protein